MAKQIEMKADLSEELAIVRDLIAANGQPVLTENALRKAATVHCCKCHGKPYTVCSLCDCEYCPLEWSRCPRASWHPGHGNDMRPLGVGDLVKVLRACRLPKVEETLGVGQIRSITRTENGTILYWINGFACARTERELRRTKTLADVYAEQEGR